MDDVETVRQMYGAFNTLSASRGFDAYVRDRWDPDCEYRPVEESEPIRGQEALIRWHERWFEAWDEFRADIEDLVPHGNVVIAAVRVSGVGAESTTAVSQLFFHVCECRDGRILRMEEYLEREDAFAAAASG